ncbi:methyl-accepting chemotaxis protein [Vreelandella zhaodongensis]|uniref:Tar ligand binding domain-containing protein n=1 Tax=Vreelandella zhaodongensis TaxID=1176240 RepID=A0ABX2SZ42_VREZH|nr:methyl-accepting chemotaxis protein [Halomonas zhaodongensis]NYS46469.1 Tar ligand binding domain-containing protein [Halomonas zhaodongensis]
MHRLNNLTMRMSWSLVLSSFLILLLLLSGTGLYAVNHSQKSIEQFTNVNVNQQATLNRTNSTLQNARIHMSHLYEEIIEPQSSMPPAERRQRADALHDALNNAANILSEFIHLPTNPAHEHFISEINASFNNMLTNHLFPQLEALYQGDVAAYQHQRHDAQVAYAQFHQDTLSFFHTVEAEGNERLADFSSVINLANMAIMLVFMTALVITAIVYWGVSANLIRPMQRINEHFLHIAKGDLSKTIEVHGRNEIGVLFNSLRNMQKDLLETVATVRHSSEEVFAGAREIALGNQDLASRTERQSASLTQTASSIEEMTATMERNSDNAAQASHVAQEAAQNAQQGGDVVTHVVSKMHEIRHSSQQITDIIGLIDSIAFQTNILALNASVEAARAGEHGRGFAVVASEVRLLATRSADAAADIRQLIGTSVSQIEAGTQQADLASESMAAIMESVKRVTTLMDEIAVASEEQRIGINEVNSAVGEMEQTTQQNAAMVEQASTSATQLEHEAERLTEVVLRFKLNSGDENTQSGIRCVSLTHQATPCT